MTNSTLCDIKMVCAVWRQGGLDIDVRVKAGSVQHAH